MMLYVCYPKCSTCKKAEQYLNEKEIEIEVRDIKLNNPSKEELKAGLKKVVWILNAFSIHLG